jgi:uncharacterized protein
MSEMIKTVASKESRNWAVGAHLGTLCGFLIPFGNFLAPFIIWLVKKNEDTYIAHHAKESVNFQINLLIWALVSGILMLILIGFLLAAVLFVAWIVLIIIASIKASDGYLYEYPFIIRFIK